MIILFKNDQKKMNLNYFNVTLIFIYNYQTETIKYVKYELMKIIIQTELMNKNNVMIF